MFSIGRFWGMDPVRVIIDESAFALKDSVQGQAAIDTLSIHVEVEPNTDYLLQVYLNDPDSDFEECWGLGERSLP